MRAYELMVIFESGLDDLVIDDQVKSVTAQIATRGGAVASTDRWGRRRFAYEIDHKTEGYYVVWELTSDGGDLEALERSLRPTGRPLAAACSATARPNRLRPGRE